MRELKVDAIKNGTVLDHIPAGKALKVLSILNPNPKDVVTIGINFSGKSQKKDILKFENLELKKEDVDKIAVLAPKATINIIHDYNVLKKYKVEVPDKLENLWDCPNPNCITRSENQKTKFVVENKEPIVLRCVYCERTFDVEEINL
jgi:aspartate carbamoyltransferase regulatory subunit